MTLVDHYRRATMMAGTDMPGALAALAEIEARREREKKAHPLGGLAICVLVFALPAYALERLLPYVVDMSRPWAKALPVAPAVAFLLLFVFLRIRSARRRGFLELVMAVHEDMQWQATKEYRDAHPPHSASQPPPLPGGAKPWLQ